MTLLVALLYMGGATAAISLVVETYFRRELTLSTNNRLESAPE
jgi:hypothetical protein